MLRFQTFSEKLKCGIHNLLTSLALYAVETENAQLFLALFVWTNDKTVYVFVIWNPVQALCEKMLTSVA